MGTGIGISVEKSLSVSEPPPAGRGDCHFIPPVRHSESVRGEMTDVARALRPSEYTVMRTEPLPLGAAFGSFTVPPLEGLVVVVLLLGSKKPSLLLVRRLAACSCAGSSDASGTGTLMADTGPNVMSMTGRFGVSILPTTGSYTDGGTGEEEGGMEGEAGREEVRMRGREGDTVT